MRIGKRDDMYFSYLSPAGLRTEKVLNAVYILLMLLTLGAAFVIAVVSYQDSTMAFFGMGICELCLFILKRGTIPLFEITFSDYKKTPDVKLRENVVYLWVGIGFFLIIGYLMMAVGVVSALQK